MRTISLELPDDVSLDPKEARMILAAKMYERGDLSSGQAAKLAEVSRREFIESLERYGVAFFSQSVEDLNQDIANARLSRS